MPCPRCWKPPGCGLRPILMTSFRLHHGVVPLMVAGGAGAEIRHGPGHDGVRGNARCVVLRPVVDPVFYVLVRRLSERNPKKVIEAPAPRSPHRKLIMSNRTIKGGVALGRRRCAGGCAVGPDYKKPDTGRWRRNSRAPRRARFSTQDAQSQFWKQFGDDTLDHLVDDALAANHDLRIALGHLAEARAARPSVSLRPGPHGHG